MRVQVGGRKDGAMSEMNVVPLIDILLVLIIMFMVIAPLTPRGLEALLPQPAPMRDRPPEGPVPNPIVVHLEAGGAIKINGEDQSWESLGSRLEAIFRERMDKVAFVKGESPVEFAEVARAISVMRSAGIEKVGLLTARMDAGW